MVGGWAYSLTVNYESIFIFHTFYKCADSTCSPQTVLAFKREAFSLIMISNMYWIINTFHHFFTSSPLVKISQILYCPYNPILFRIK
jgi:hypothetical protein